MVKMRSAKRPRFQTFQKLAPLRQVFSFSTYSKAFATYLKSYIMKPRASRNVGCFLRLRGEKQGEESRQFPRSHTLSTAQECSHLRRVLQFNYAQLSLNMKTESDFYSRICLLRDTEVSIFK